MHGFDTVDYGSNLSEYFENEFGGHHVVGTVRHIALWSDIAEKPKIAYAYYHSSDEYKEMAAMMARQREGRVSRASRSLA